MRDFRRPPAPRRPRVGARSRLTFRLRFSALEGAAVCAHLERYCRDAALSLSVGQQVSRRHAVLEGEAIGEEAAVARLERWLRGNCRDGELAVTPLR